VELTKGQSNVEFARERAITEEAYDRWRGGSGDLRVDQAKLTCER